MRAERRMPGRTARALAMGAVFVLGGVAGALAHRAGLHRVLTSHLGAEPEPAPAETLWPRFFPARAGVKVDAEVAAELSALGYAAGYEEGASGDGSAVLLDGAGSGWNLHTTGHAPEARLLDMRGRLLHRWHFDDPEPPTEASGGRWWRRAEVGPAGELYAIEDFHSLLKLDASSKLLWRYDGGCHHDLEVRPDGHVFVIGAELRNADAIGGRPVVDDYVVELDAEGRPLRRVSVLDAIARSHWSALLARVPPGTDVLHTNRLRVLDGWNAERIPAMRPGRVLVGIRQLDTVAVIDLDLQEVVWALTGPWHRQHGPELLPNGHLLVFDNLGAAGGSRVLEVDPATQEVVWQYPDGGATRLASDVMGTAQRLDNGNTLVVESTAGRVFEVTPDGRVVWEYRNPERAGEHGELIAAIPDWVRLPEQTPLAWLPKRDDPQR